MRSVYLFGTCLVDLFFPEAGMAAAIRLLEREGFRVIYPQGQTCCGPPAFNCGFEAEARAVARAPPLRRELFWIVNPSQGN